MTLDIGWCAPIEPLNREESNQRNGVADGVHPARVSDKADAGSLADLYCVDEEQEPFEKFRRLGASIVHVHAADTGRLSGECGFKGEPVASMRESASFLRQAWQRSA